MWHLPEKPRPKYDIASIVIFNHPHGPSRQLFLISSREFMCCTGDKYKKWYYCGPLLEVKKTDDADIPYAPVIFTGLSNASEECISPLEEILK